MADITYVPITTGFCYTAFITDAFSRKIVGWATKSSLTTEALPLEALDQALAAAHGQHLNQLIHHSDRGCQYVSIRYTDRLTQASITGSVGATGDSYDNALAEAINGLYKTELIYTRQIWPSVKQVEYETMKWVNWYNHQRLHETLNYHTPQEIENNYNQTRVPTPALT